MHKEHYIATDCCLPYIVVFPPQLYHKASDKYMYVAPPSPDDKLPVVSAIQ